MVFGPNNSHFQEAQGLIGAQGGFEISSSTDFDALMQRFDKEAEFLKASGEEAGKYVQSRAGATAKVMQGVAHL